MNTLIIYTGGTIGMMADEQSQMLIPSNGDHVKDFLQTHHKEEYSYVNFDEAIDSVNFDFFRVQRLVELLEQSYQKYDSILILMGTDTMAYVSNLVSFMVQNLSKPILFSGGQYPLNAPNSDSKSNLLGALQLLANNIVPNEVLIYFDGTYFQANRTVKVDNVQLHAFDTPNGANYKSVNHSINKPFFVKTGNPNVDVLYVNPFLPLQSVKKVLRNINSEGIVIVGFGNGNLPDYDLEFYQMVKLKIQNGCKIAIASQCYKGRVSIHKYQSSVRIAETGVLSTKDMTLTAAITKMIYLLALNLSDNEFKLQYESNLCGEISIC